MLRTILAHYGFQPQQGNEKLYLSPFTGESTPSFHIDYGSEQGKWKCFSSTKGGNDIQLILELEELNGRKLLPKEITKKDGTHMTLTPAMQAYNLKKIMTGEQQEYTPRPQASQATEKKGNEIVSIKPVQNVALKNLLTSRGISEALFSFIEEVSYLNHKSGKTFFGVCLKNDSGGVAHRNKLEFGKGNIGRADITTFRQPKNKELKVFEGMFDFWSYLTLTKEKNPFELKYDVVVLNSTTHIKRLAIVLEATNYDTISSYMDNGTSGDLATIELFLMRGDSNFIDKRKSMKRKDMRGKQFDDLNDFLIGKPLTKRQVRVFLFDNVYNIYYKGELILTTMLDFKTVSKIVNDLKAFTKKEDPTAEYVQRIIHTIKGQKNEIN